MQESVRLIEHDPFSDLDIPPELEASIQRHRAHLAQLVHTMQTAGISSGQIEESISEIVASYKEELVRTIKSIVR